MFSPTRGALTPTLRILAVSEPCANVCVRSISCEWPRAERWSRASARSGASRVCPDFVHERRGQL